VSSAFAEDAPLLLSNEHVDMTASEIEAVQPAPVQAAAAAAAPPAGDPGSIGRAAPNWGSEFVSNEGGEANASGDASLAIPLPAPGSAIAGFGQCMEVSIRGGVGYDPASTVCRALFPGQG